MKQYLTPQSLLKAMIYTNIFMFVVSLIFSGSKIGFNMNPFNALTPSTDALSFLGASGKIPILQFQTWWSLITANWLHGSLLHIVFNMLALRTVAPLVMHEFGLARMFIIYTLAGAAGFLLSFLGNVYLTIGASSGICGLIGALLYFGKSRGGLWGQQVAKQVSGWIISLALIGFLLPNINNWGHGGGLIGGIFFAWLLGYNDKRKENLLDRFGALSLGILTIVLLLIPVFQGMVLIFT